MVAATNIIILPQPGSIAELERVARYELSEAQEFTQIALDRARQAQAHWLNFYDSVQQLQDMGAHTHAGKTWRQYYCELTGLKDDSHFRLLRRVAAHARIIEAQTGVTPTEWELRNFPIKDIPVSQPQLIVSTYEAAKQTALVRSQIDGKKQAAPSAADYKIANAVIEDMVANQGIYLPELDATFAVDAMIKNHILEKANSLRDNAIRHSEYETVERHAITGEAELAALWDKLVSHIRNSGRIHIQVQQLKEE